ncbi:MAG: spore protease YyaC [Clostridiales bacterium]|jgi:putative sporulation protein YyaC|nr:spore protease YyaC [Clostridiales bacterium]
MPEKLTNGAEIMVGSLSDARENQTGSFEKQTENANISVNGTDGLPVIMCIGSDRVAGDLLGPAVGRRLIEEYGLKAYVYGITGRNINGANIDRYDEFIKTNHRDGKIIAVDACLGSAKDIGGIKVSGVGVGAGYAVGKSGKRYGDIGVVGIVAENAEDNVMQLLSADCGLIEDLSGKVAEYIADNLDTLLGKHPARKRS